MTDVARGANRENSNLPEEVEFRRSSLRERESVFEQVSVKCVELIVFFYVFFNRRISSLVSSNDNKYITYRI